MGDKLGADSADCLLAFDIGGSHVSAGRCSLDTLSVAAVVSAPLLGVSSARSFVDTLQELGHEISEGLPAPVGASLAFPGPFNYTAGISLMQHKLEPLFGFDLKSELACRFGWPPDKILFLNDADAALLGEIGAGAAAGAKRAVGIWLGTGIGSAFAQDGRLVTEAEGVPPGGEVWNLPFRGGILEDTLSTRALQQDYFSKTGNQESVASIAARVPGDSAAQAVFETFGCNLGSALDEILALFAPQVVVIGGGISQSSHLFLPTARLQIRSFKTELVPSTLLENAPLVGATLYWRNCNSEQLANLSSPAVAR